MKSVIPEVGSTNVKHSLHTYWIILAILMHCHTYKNGYGWL